MKRAIDYVTLTLFALFAPLALAAVGEGGALAPEPQVDTIWVFVFLVLFVGICVWIGVAIWRAEHKNKKAS